jgi:hypothetical protein
MTFMKKAAGMLCVLALATTLGATSASAGPNRLGGKFGVVGNFGGSLVSMSALNDSLDGTVLGFTILGYDSVATHIIGGPQFNAGVQYAIFDYLAAGVEGGMVMPNTGAYTIKGSLTGFDHFDEEVDFNLPATEFGVYIKGMLPAGSHFLFNAQLGLDLVNLSGTFTDKDNLTGTSQTGTLTGSTVGIKAQVGLEVFLAQFLSLGLDLGYRSADITSVTAKDSNGNEIPTNNNYVTEVSYTGVYGQGGIRIYF